MSNVRNDTENRERERNTDKHEAVDVNDQKFSTEIFLEYSG